MNKRSSNLVYAQHTLRCGLFGLLMVAFQSVAAPVNLMTDRDASVPLPAGGNDDSVAPTLTPDGRFVVFTSAANDLVPGGNSQAVLNIYLRDRTSNTTALVSASLSGVGGGNGNSILGSVSSNGLFVVFQSDASDLMANDTNSLTDIFVRDVVAGTTTLVSVATNGASADGASTDPVITPDGRYVAFISKASNLVPGDTNMIADVFVRDRLAGTTALVSVGAFGTGTPAVASMDSPRISPDGRYLAFCSNARGLANGVPSTTLGEVYLRDTVANTTAWVSAGAAALVLSNLGLSSAASYHPSLSDDGTFVAFKAGPTYGPGGVLVMQFDSASTNITLINTNCLPSILGADDPYGPEMTPDGQFICYVQREPTGGPSASSVRVWLRQTGWDIVVSDPGSGGVISTSSLRPVICPDAGHIAFLSNASNLVANAVAPGYHLYLRDLTSDTLLLVDVDTNGIGSTDDELSSYNLSADGMVVAFDSPDGSLVSQDHNRAQDVLVRNVASAVTELISSRAASVVPSTGDGYSCLSQLATSADGRYVVFASLADDLVPDDTNRLQDIFVRDQVAGTTRLVSRAADGSAANGASYGAVISADGRYAAFISAASNLVAGLSPSNANIYRCDLQSGAIALVSVDTNGVGGANANCSDPVISRDGRYLAYISAGGNLSTNTPGGPGSAKVNTYWRDMNSGSTLGLPGMTYFKYPPSMSSNGRYVAYSGVSGSTAQLRIRDTQLGTDVYINAGNISSAALSPDASKISYRSILAGTSFPALSVDQVKPAPGPLLSIESVAVLRNAAEWSDDGRFIAFVSPTNSVTGDDGTNKIYLYDFQSQTLTLLGTGGPSAGSLAPWSEAPSISGDGRYVVYRSAVLNTIDADTNSPPNAFLFDRLSGSNVVLTAGHTGTSPFGWVSAPAASANGFSVTFLDLGDGLAANDFNRLQDSFSVLNSATPLDSDADGIPDWWMNLYFGHPTGQAGDASLANADADGDGMSNQQEYLAGTDPDNAASALRLVSAVPGVSGLTVTWSSVVGKTYSVQRSSDLMAQSNFVTLQSNIAGQPGVTTWLDTTAQGPGPFYYRVGLQ